MQLASVFELRDQTLAKLYEVDLKENAAVRATASSVPSIPERRIAIGARFRGRDDYQIAIRVQRETGIAMRRARELIRSLPNEDEADFAILRKVSVPSRVALATAAQGTGRHPGAVCKRPIEIGFSIGHLNGGPGTLGLLADSDKHGVVALSNNHVIALANRAHPDDEIYQCGIPDGPPDDDKVIGILGGYRKIRSVGSNVFDAAYCVVRPDLEQNSNRIPTDFGPLDAGKRLKDCLSQDDLVKTVRRMKDDDKITVAKLGRTTGYTSANINSVAFGVNELIVDIPSLGNCRFDNAVEIEWTANDEPFTKDGDSGSALYLERVCSPFGLMFASGTVERGNETSWVSYACLLSPIYEAYGLDSLR